MPQGRDYTPQVNGGPDELSREVSAEDRMDSAPSRVYAAQVGGGPDELARGEEQDRDQLLANTEAPAPEAPEASAPADDRDDAEAEARGTLDLDE